MPNFVADEVITFYLDREGSGEWLHISTVVEDEITRKSDQPAGFSPERNAVARDRLDDPNIWFRTGPSRHWFRRCAGAAV